MDYGQNQYYRRLKLLSSGFSVDGFFKTNPNIRYIQIFQYLFDPYMSICAELILNTTMNRNGEFDSITVRNEIVLK